MPKEQKTENADKNLKKSSPHSTSPNSAIPNNSPNSKPSSMQEYVKKSLKNQSQLISQKELELQKKHEDMDERNDYSRSHSKVILEEMNHKKNNNDSPPR